ncbi:MAG: LysM peptidoglycan-binding domain-containing protein [Calditrichia bacterium]
MSLQDKYRGVLDLGKKFDVKDGFIKEEGGVLKIGGTAKTQMEKDQMWDKIKELGGDKASDIMAEINVEVTEYYGTYTVQPGDSLSKIAKQVWGSFNKYTAIYEANRDQLDNPDVIKVGQVLKIPFLND